jgi:AcrR family transcriptional regulator
VIASNRRPTPAIDNVLDAAEAEFSERGFAAARIDDIAARAGMAKSHVYYHFTGKQEIFDALVDTRVAEILQAKDTLFAGVGEEPVAASDLAQLAPQAVGRLLGERAAFLRIVLQAGLTTDGSAGTNSLLARVVTPFLDDVAERLTAMGYVFDAGQLRSDAFHFILLPAVMHVVLGEALPTLIGVSPERAGELFLTTLAALDQQLVNALTEET